MDEENENLELFMKRNEIHRKRVKKDCRNWDV